MKPSMSLFNNLAYVLLIIPIQIIFANTDPIEGRYSFSLTTFHPSGKLPQLDHATKASTLGPPIIAIPLKNNNGIILSSLQSLPSPLINDDGTSRFVKISNSIIVGHTGVNADGRVLSEAAQRLSVEHSYTFQEEIPINTLLEEMALLFQEYTMKPGCRPFGCCLLIALLGEGGNGCLYRIDPTGTVTKIDSIAYVGRGNREQIMERLIESDCVNAVDIDKAEEILINIMRDEIGTGLGLSESKFEKETNGILSSSFICAKLSNERNLESRRIPFLASEQNP
mmetsp:Transcript_25822/g.31838  ORF Transcript_25822/g.31838 Transcript_25822/m.31838 type:complete len:282 (+) Transcript_25822:67-912(+)